MTSERIAESFYVIHADREEIISCNLKGEMYISFHIVMRKKNLKTKVIILFDLILKKNIYLLE